VQRLKIANRFSGTKAGVSAFHCISFMLLTRNQVKENIQLVKSIAKLHKSGDFEFARTPEEGKTLWSARKESLWSMLALRREGDEVWSTDVAVPISRLPDIIGMCIAFDFSSVY
jgi:FAD/FMN-containing dehydrogenase